MTPGERHPAVESSVGAGGMRIMTVGEGKPVLFLHGYAMTPPVYKATASLLAERAGVSVVMPWLFALPQQWSPGRVLDDLTAIIDGLGPGPISIIGHSFSGALELELAARRPDRVAELVFADTLGVAREWKLAGEFGRHPAGIVRMATVPAVAAFTWSALRHPAQLARAGWWGFVSDRQSQIDAVHARGIPSHVLWADRDALLARSDGEEFAAELGATFTLARSAQADRVDHDWVFRHPSLFVDRLGELNLEMFKPAPAAGPAPGAMMNHGRPPSRTRTAPSSRVRRGGTGR